jgi:hypothetical protein
LILKDLIERLKKRLKTNNDEVVKPASTPFGNVQGKTTTPQSYNKPMGASSYLVAKQKEKENDIQNSNEKNQVFIKGNEVKEIKGNWEEEESEDMDPGDDWGAPAKPDFSKVDYNNYDLNKLGDQELKQHKDKMDEVFLKNKKDPKSGEFVYDLRADFGGEKGACDWDEEAEDDEDYFDDDFS